MTADDLKRLLPIGAEYFYDGEAHTVLYVEAMRDNPSGFAIVTLMDRLGQERVLMCLHASWEGELVWQET